MPSGTHTFLFTDIEGSTRRWQSHPDEMREALARHDALVREAVARAGGRVFKAIGDAFCAAFPTAPEALAAALGVQRALAAQPWGPSGPLRVRAALHTGAAEERDDDYFGPSLNRVARLLSAGHGGQTLLTRAAADAVADAMPRGASLRDLGDRRLKDLALPERVFQLVAPELASEFPPLRTLDARPNNLPAQATSLIGRAEELAQLRAILRKGGVRLVTLSGPGGTGKTRLALQAAADIAEAYEHGVWFVALAPIRDPLLVLPAIAAAFGVKEASGRLLAEGLGDFLRDRKLLLLLDNFEQVAGAGAEVAGLLASAPGLSILVTSRSLLRVYGEHDFPVPPLSRGARQCDSVSLFIERALAVKPDFKVDEKGRETLAAICTELDGLPLAIELAAARIRLFTPEAMLEQLCRVCGAGGSLEFLTGGARDRPERQRTIRGAIAWSYELLDDEERTAFRRLGVFSGGCDREAATSVLGGRGVPEILESLLDKSLLRVCLSGGEARFEMLETLRDFALERLEADGERTQYRARHAAYFLALAENGGSRLTGPDQQAWSGRLDRELDNFRAALSHAVGRRDAGAALRFGADLGTLWEQRGIYTEGRRHLEAVVAMEGEGRPDSRARAVLALGQMHRGLGELPQARARLEAALELFRALDDRGGIIDALTALAWVAMYQGDVERGKGLTQELLAEARRLDDPRRQALALERAAWIEQEKDDQPQALAYLEQALELMRPARDKLGLALVINVLGEHIRNAGDFERAARLYEESLTLARELKSPFWITVSAMNLGICLLRLGKPAQAFPLLSEALAGTHAIGNKRNVPPIVIGVAALAVAGGAPERAAVLLGAAEKFLVDQGTVLVYADRGEHEETARSIRAALSPAAFGSAMTAGRGLALDAAVSQALALAAQLKFEADG